MLQPKRAEFMGLDKQVFRGVGLIPSRSPKPGSRDDDPSTDKVRTKLLSMWNNMKFEVSTRLKNNFSDDTEVCFLGRSYNRRLRNCPLSDRNAVPYDFSSNSDLEKFRDDFTSRIWLTYRREFQALPGSTYTSDCGWGCMLRSGQMMLAQALITHFLGRDWRWMPETSQFCPGSGSERLHRLIISWFGDSAAMQCPFSLHRLVTIGQNTGRKAGDWYGPASVSHILRQAMEIAATDVPELSEVAIYVAKDCTVYRQEVLDLCSRSKSKPAQKKPQQQRLYPQLDPAATSYLIVDGTDEPKLETYKSSSQTDSFLSQQGFCVIPPSVPCMGNSRTNELLDSDEDFKLEIVPYPSGMARMPLLRSNDRIEQAREASELSDSLTSWEAVPPLKPNLLFAQQNSGASSKKYPPLYPKLTEQTRSECTSVDWRSVLILIPVRLGGERPNPLYAECVKAALKSKYSVGIIGGKPKHSLYFLGWQEDKLIFLDPHYCQDAVNVSQADFPLDSFHCSHPRKLPYSRIDPSCCIGFFCENRNELEDFFTSCNNMAPQWPHANYPMFVVSDNYSPSFSENSVPVSTPTVCASNNSDSSIFEQSCIRLPSSSSPKPQHTRRHSYGSWDKVGANDDNTVDDEEEYVILDNYFA